jgi:galactonate dehydratase
VSHEPLARPIKNLKGRLGVSRPAGLSGSNVHLNSAALAAKVEEVRCTVVGSPWRDLTFVELVTNTGLTGLSEVRMVNKTETLVSCIRELAPRYLVGSSPFDTAKLAWNFQRAEYGRAGEVAQSALSAFEVACWDIMGQLLNVPIYSLIGGRFRDRVPAYANGWYQSERDPEAVAELAAAVVARGYRALKLDPFGAAHGSMTPAARKCSSDIVAAVRERVGPDVEVMIEMHGRFSRGEASRLARLLAQYDPAWIEEPVAPDQPDAFRRLRSTTNLEIAAGERVHTLAEFAPWIEGGLLDIVQADLTHFGGFRPMIQLAAWADAHSMELAPHNVCGPVGTAANIQFAAVIPNFRILEHFNDFADPWVLGLVDSPPTVSRGDGSFAVSERPGLGVRLNHDACAEHPATGAHLNLFKPGWEMRASDVGGPHS